MHPYRPDLNGKDLTEYVDPRGNRIFVEFVSVAKNKAGGYVEYVWQWKDQPERLAPKESYVKGFDPWGWVIGTGMYIEDVQEEIGRLLGRLLWIFMAIIGAVALLLLYVVRQSMKIEQQRNRSDSALRESHEKYRALVEVTTEGIVMVLDGRCAYLNHAMLDMLDYHEDEALLLDLHDLFPPDAGIAGSGADALAALLEGRPVVEQFDARLRKKNGESVDVVLAATTISFAGKNGVILIAKDVTTHKQLEDELLGGRRSGGALADQIDLGVFRVSVGRRLAFTDANPVARRLFGLPDAGDLSATDLLDVFLEPKVGADLRRDMETQGAVSARIAQLKPQRGHAPIVSLSLATVQGQRRCAPLGRLGAGCDGPEAAGVAARNAHRRAPDVADVPERPDQARPTPSAHLRPGAADWEGRGTDDAPRQQRALRDLAVGSGPRHRHGSRLS